MRRISFILLTALLCTAVFAQNRQNSAYTIPLKVYVGDRASLVLPLPGITGNRDAKISMDYIPSSADIDIHHITLEQRPGGSFLTIEFSAYTPGILELPPITIAGEIISGLTIEISSILDPDESGITLSGPAMPLAIPGASLLIYGTISAIILSMLTAVWFLVWGRNRMKNWLAAWKRRRLLAAMIYTERRLYRALSKGSGHREILDSLTREFRGFLAGFTGENYRAMTAEEIGLLTGAGAENAIPGGESLSGFFGRCDGIRFSGGKINKNEIMAILDELKHFLITLDRSMRGKTA